jgi:hypothetical protein
MAHFINAKKGIFVQVKPPMKPLAHPDSTPPNQDPLRALNAHPERMPILFVPKFAMLVPKIPTNRTPMLRNAFQCKKGSTNRAPQPKSNARRVKLELVVTKRVKIVTLGYTKTCPATPRALNAQLALATKPNVRQHAMRCHPVPTV